MADTGKLGYLVGYNYGQGGLWAYVLAESAEQITEAFSDVEVFHQRPPWMTDAIASELQVFDVEKPEGWLAMLARVQ